MGLHRFISCNRCIRLVKDVIVGGSYVHVGTGAMWEILILSTPFCCELKTDLKIKVYFKI